MRIKVYTNLLKLLPALPLLWAISCTDEMENHPHSSTELSDEPVMVYAGTVATGAAIRSGNTGPWVGENTPIKDRTMLFTYPSQPYGEMKSAYCVFDGNGIGRVYTDMMNYPDCKQRLRWKDILTGAASYPGDAVDAVFLDNLVNYPVEDKTWPVPGGKNGEKFTINFFTRILTCKEQPKSNLVPNAIEHGQNPETAFVEENKNKPHDNYRFRQMIAPVGHKEAEEVDIIWGKIDKPTPNKSLNFKLEHQMSAISFRFYTEDNQLEEQLAGATEVWMDEVRIWLDDRNIDGNYGNVLYSSFNRKDGSVYGRSDLYRENQTANGLYLVQAGNEDKRLTELIKDDSDALRSYYTTPMWIVPPYKWKLGATFPKVSLRLKDGKLYTGRLPEKIVYWELQNGQWVQTNTLPLRFWKGQHATFKVKLISGDEKFELLFENVTVSPFISWGKFDDPTLAESGIYSGEDLDNLTKTYNANSASDNYRLLRYGRHDGEKWIFRLWRRIDIPIEQPLPKFNNDRFRIEEGSYGIYHGDQKVTEDKLLAYPQP